MHFQQINFHISERWPFAVKMSKVIAQYIFLIVLKAKGLQSPTELSQAIPDRFVHVLQLAKKWPPLMWYFSLFMQTSIWISTQPYLSFSQEAPSSLFFENTKGLHHSIYSLILSRPSHDLPRRPSQLHLLSCISSSVSGTAAPWNMIFSAQVFFPEPSQNLPLLSFRPKCTSSAERRVEP